MATDVRAEADDGALEREWWLRTLQVLQRPRLVFAALRDDSDPPAAARQEPMAALVLLAGIAAFVATPTAAHLYDDFEYDVLVVAVQTIFAGAIVGLQNYWLGGAALYAGAHGLGSKISYRQARHAVGFASIPLILALLLVWPVEIAVYGSDLFRTGGDDAGAGRWLFHGLWLAAGTCVLGLLVLGVRVLNGWSWPRSMAATALAAVVLLATAVVFAVL